MSRCGSLRSQRLETTSIISYHDPMPSPNRAPARPTRCASLSPDLGFAARRGAALLPIRHRAQGAL